MSEDFDIRSKAAEADKDFERALRPDAFSAFNGQEKVVENLKIFRAGRSHAQGIA